jgi:beta-1,4-mannosyltransferase
VVASGLLLVSSLWIIWLITGALSVFEIGRFFQNRHRFEKKVGNVPVQSPRIVFSFATKSCPDVTVRAVKRIHEVCGSIGLKDYLVDVVSDRQDTKVDGAFDVIVPTDYQTPNRTRYKSRALHYAVEQRRERGLNDQETWIFHLDEESFVTEQTVRAILDYIHHPGARPIASGPIVYPNEWDKCSFLAKVMESVRVYTCYQCVSWMTSSVPIYMHGSNLLVRADVEDAVGWDFGVTSSEDQRFAQEASVRIKSAGVRGVGEDQEFAFAARWKFKDDRIFDWHGGVLEEQPPFTVGDFIKQRQRWFMGNLSNLRYARIPRRIKLVLATRQGIWALGFAGAIAAFIALVIPQHKPVLVQDALYGILVTWAARWQVGLHLNTKTLPISLWKKAGYHVTTLLLTPVLAVIETYPAVSGLWLYAKYANKSWTWKPTPK